VSPVGGVGFRPAKLANPKGQGTLLGVYRWLVLSLISYVLAHWAYLSYSGGFDALPDWGEAAEIAFQTIFPHLAVLLLLQDIERLRELARSSRN
jgi:hypothetical protein